MISLIQASALILVSALSSIAPSTFVQIEQFEAARSLGNGALAGLLRSSDRGVALRAALAIGRTKRYDGAALLIPRATSSDPAMRAVTVYGLGLIGGRSAARAILRALLHDSNGAVQIAALDASDRLETSGTFSPAQEEQAARRARELLGLGDVVVRARAAATLEAFHGTPLSAAIVSSLDRAFLREPDSYVRWHIMWTLFRAYAKEAPLSTLERGLHDSSDVVRIQAVRALGRRGNTSTIGLLQPLTADPSWRVQEQALESIKVLQGGALTEHWKAIPPGIHIPPPEPDRFASIPALPRTEALKKPAAPAAAQIETSPLLAPSTIALMTGPARGAHPRVRLVTTKGNIYLELFPEWAPLTVENFLNLTNAGYYDNNPWFRIVPDFVVQTGDPTGNGNGDAGYAIPAEENPIEQNSYVISMGMNYTNPPNAHAIRDSAGTQFYITLSPQLHLDRDFTVFGRVIGGTDVLGRLVESDKIVRAERIPDSRQ